MIEKHSFFVGEGTDVRRAAFTTYPTDLSDMGLGLFYNFFTAKLRSVIIEREAFLLMPAVVGGRSAEEIAVEHGLARTVYTLAALVEQGIITFQDKRLSG